LRVDDSNLVSIHWWVLQRPQSRRALGSIGRRRAQQLQAPKTAQRSPAPKRIKPLSSNQVRLAPPTSRYL
ncbi:hypothetical protein PHYSODRAFT_286922, partial [Phytophthora sojae]